MSEEQQHHIDEQEYNELMKAVGDSGLSAIEKDNLRELLSAGYRNLNGDPMETKVKLLARTDWIQIKRTLAESDKMQRILNALEAIQKGLKAKPVGFVAQLFDFLKDAKAWIAAVIITAYFAPKGVEVLESIRQMIVLGGGR